MEPMEPMKPMQPMKPMKPMKPMEPMRWSEPERWWPTNLGSPNSSGGQGDAQYAYFAGPRRLALRDGSGKVTLYDTADHQIGGVSQQQSGRRGTLVFTSQDGEVSLETLKVVDC